MYVGYVSYNLILKRHFSHALDKLIYQTSVLFWLSSSKTIILIVSGWLEYLHLPECHYEVGLSHHSVRFT